MARDGRVDLEVDETRGAVVYCVRGLSTSTGRLLPDVHLVGWRMPATLGLMPSKSVTMEVLLGGIIPGLGFAYAAPLRVVLLVSFIVIALADLVGAHMMLGPIFWMGSSILSALFGGLYAVRFNQEGHRAALHPLFVHVRNIVVTNVRTRDLVHCRSNNNSVRSEHVEE